MDSESSVSLEAWKEAARALRVEQGFDDQFTKDVQERFRRALMKQYWKPLYDTAMDRTKHAERIWSAIIDIDRTTPYRWRGDLTGHEDEQRSREPAFHHVVKSLAAFDLDGTVFPRGLTATLAAYVETLEYIASIVRGKTEQTSDGITVEEVLYLHLSIRTTDWCEACLSGDTEQQQLASANLMRRVGNIVGKPTIGTFSAIRAVLEKYFVPWALLETVIVYDWIQS